MRDNLWDDPRVAKIVDLTDSSEAAVVGSLYWLWATADQHTEDGVMPGLTLRSIDRKTGVKGFAEALCAIDWLADHPEGVRIIDFEKHNGSSAKKRCQTAKRVANFAAANAPQSKVEETTNAPSVSTALARGREEKEKIASEAKASGGKPPMSADEIIFGYGLPLLTTAGTAEKQARSFLGGLRKTHGDDALVNTLRECIRAKPLQPLEWLAKAMPPAETGATKTPNKQEALEARNKKITDEWVAQGEAIEVH